MATITVTPGHTYGTTDTVTSTNLNDLGSPTAALTAGSILTADIADANVTTAKIADANVTFAKLTDVIDDDTMATATDTTLSTSESIKAYVDSTTYIPNVVQAVKTDTFVEPDPQYAWFDIPDLELSITPSSSSSKILIRADISSSGAPRFRFVRDGVAIALGDADGSAVQCSFVGSQSTTYGPGSSGMSYLDSTAVVAGTPVEYKVQCSNYGSADIFINQPASINNTALYTRTISTLTATEIPQ